MKNALPDSIRDALNSTTTLNVLSEEQLRLLTAWYFVKDAMEKLQDVEQLLSQSRIVKEANTLALPNDLAALSPSERLRLLSEKYRGK